MNKHFNINVYICPSSSDILDSQHSTHHCAIYWTCPSTPTQLFAKPSAHDPVELHQFWLHTHWTSTDHHQTLFSSRLTSDKSPRALSLILLKVRLPRQVPSSPLTLSSSRSAPHCLLHRVEQWCTSLALFRSSSADSSRVIFAQLISFSPAAEVPLLSQSFSSSSTSLTAAFLSTWNVTMFTSPDRINKASVSTHRVQNFSELFLLWISAILPTTLSSAAKIPNLSIGRKFWSLLRTTLFKCQNSKWDLF